MTGPDADAPVLRVRGLRVALPAGADRADAVHGIDLDVPPGRTVCLVGESGSGKSVTAFATMGLLPRALRTVAGSIRVGGSGITGGDGNARGAGIAGGAGTAGGSGITGGTEIVGAKAATLRRLRGPAMGMVFQEPMTALNPVVRCGEQIDEMIRAHTRLSAAQRRARALDIVEAVRLPEPARMMRSYPHQLSGGQRQRIMIAMALVLRPALLIADEPTTALDVTTQARILDALDALRRERGTGVLFITHDFGVVSRIADHVVVMRHGHVVEQGPADTVLGAPQHAYTRMLIDAVPRGVRVTVPGATVPVLDVQRLGKSYPAAATWRRAAPVVAVGDVSLRIGRGRTLGVVGESGSGKSTLARCIARLVEPDAGRIELDGTDIAHLSARALHRWRPRVQMVFQDPYRSLNPRRTIGQSMIEGPMNHGLGAAAARARAAELMTLVGLTEAALTRLPHEFSGGQRQRICIARALALEPDLLIADEAVSALDMSVQAQILRLLDDVQRRLGLAILFITHDLRVAAQSCDELVVMRAGRIVETGPTARVLAAPAHPYTAELLAAAPVLRPSRPPVPAGLSAPARPPAPGC